MDTYLSVLWWPLVLEAVASGVPQSQLYSLRFKLISLLSRTEVAAATTSIRSSWLNLITSMCIGKAKAKKSKAHRCTNTDESINAEHTALTMTWKKAIVWTAAVASALLFTYQLLLARYCLHCIVQLLRARWFCFYLWICAKQMNLVGHGLFSVNMAENEWNGGETYSRISRHDLPEAAVEN